MIDEIINNISILANIFTILGFIIALITFIYFLVDYKTKLEYEVRKNLIDKISWTNEGDISSQDPIFFSLHINLPDCYIFSGNIELSNYSDKLTFYFVKAHGKSLKIKIHKNIGYRDVDLAIVKLKVINPDLIQMTLIKGFEEDSYKPKLPYKTLIWPLKPNNQID